MKRIVFFAKSKEDWFAFYTEGDEILGVVLPRKEYPTFEAFLNELPRCEDAPISDHDLIGATIMLVKEVE
jgi:hypothetical protein